MTIIQKIHTLGYEIKPENDGAMIWRKKIGFLTISKIGDTKTTPIYNNSSIIAIGCGPCRNDDEAKTKAAQGIGCVTTGEEIYRSYYAEGKTDREWELLNVCYSERSYDALEEEKQRLHLLRTEYEEDGSYLPLKNSEIVFIGWNEGQLGQVVDSCEWCLQYCKQYGIDGFATNYYFFSQKPSQEEALRAVELTSIHFNLCTPKVPETYICRECGHQCFWLDNGGSDIYECAARAADKYCGC